MQSTNEFLKLHIIIQPNYDQRIENNTNIFCFCFDISIFYANFNS